MTTETTDRASEDTTRTSHDPESVVHAHALERELRQIAWMKTMEQIEDYVFYSRSGYIGWMGRDGERVWAHALITRALEIERLRSSVVAGVAS